MPGPGGGGHGGGFGGGGHGGGGFGGGHGGGFSGGRGGGFHGHVGGYRGPYGPRRPRRGGCFFFPFMGGCLGALLTPILCIVLAVVMLIALIAGGFGTLVRGGTVTYDERKMQAYANAQYATVYDPSSASYEDNVLLVLTLNEDLQTYYCIGWVGDNLRSDVSNLFGNEYTKLGNAVQSSINGSGYQYSLGSNLAEVTEKMQSAVESLNLSTVYRSEKVSSHAAGQVFNRSNAAQFNVETVNAALKAFTESTDISMSIVVVDSTFVFGRSLNFGAILALLLIVVLVVCAVIGIVKYVRRKSRRG